MYKLYLSIIYIVYVVNEIMSPKVILNCNKAVIARDGYISLLFAFLETCDK